MNAHDISFRRIDGADLPLRAWAGRPVLVVNVASACGFTPQYQGLQQLWRARRDGGLVVLGVPCNDFGGQEPGSESEIVAFCTTRYQADSPPTAKVAAVGAGAHPFFRWIEAEAGEAAAPKWNFHKYLVGADGGLAGAWPSRVKPDDPAIVAAIEAEPGA